MTEPSVTSAQPYLLRAMHEWMTDNGQTPLIVVDATKEGVIVPTEHIRDGRIVLNIAWTATRNLQLGNEAIVFQARFSGVAQGVTLPVDAVLGIYARETTQGMWFQDESERQPEQTEPGNSDAVEAGDRQSTAAKPRPQRGSPNLRIVK